MWRWLLISSLFATDSFGCGNWRYANNADYNVNAEYTDTAATQADCCIFCRGHLQTSVLIIAATSEANKCWCNKHKYNNINVGGYLFTMTIYRPPLNKFDTNLTVGQSYDVYVTVQEFQNASDILKIYAITDLNNPLDGNGCISINSFSEHNGLTAPAARVLQMSETTRQNVAIVETFESNTNYFVMVHYAFNFAVADRSIEDGGTLWMTSFFANNQYTVVDLKQFTVNQPASKSCELTNIDIAWKESNREFIVDVKMETSSSCNTDLTNIRVVVHHTPDIEMNNLKYDHHSIRATTVNKASSSVELTFDRLFIRSNINITMEYGFSKQFRGLKEVMFVVDVLYTNIAANVRLPQALAEKFRKMIYGEGANVFYVRHGDSALCMMKNGDTVEANDECMLFQQIPHNLLGLDGSMIPQCLNVDTIATFANCTKEKRFSMTQRVIKSLLGTYVYTSGSKSSGYSLSSSSSLLHREYQNSNFKYSEDMVLSSEISEVSLFVYQDAFSICTPGLKKSAACIRYDVVKKKVTKYPPQIKEVLGMDDKSILYGRNEKGRYLTYNAKREIPLLYISARMLEKFESNKNVIKSKMYNRSDMISSNDNFTADGKDYKVTYYGLYDLADLVHVVIWPLNTANCKDTISKMEILALHSCKEIKQACKAAESGVYWIGGNDLSVKKKVYCDMDTDDGGWMLITNYTITDGVYIPISSHATSDVHDIAASNYTKYLTPSGLRNLQSFISFSQMRFYCTTDVGNTMHLKFLPHPSFGSVLNWLQGSTSTQYRYGRVALYEDDDAHLSRDGGRWGTYRYMGNCFLGQCWLFPNYITESGNYMIGDYRYRTNSLYRKCIFSVASGRSWWVGYDNKLLCDASSQPHNLKYGTWKIYVR